MRLGLSPETVKTHVASMLAKLGLADRHELAHWRPAEERRRFLGFLTLPGALASVGRPLLWAGTGLVTAAGVAVVALAVIGIAADTDPSVESTLPALEPTFESALPPPDPSVERDPPALNPHLVRECSEGGAVPDPENNPGLVEDCAILLEAKEALAGEDGLLNWSAELAVAWWSGIELSPSSSLPVAAPGARVVGIRLESEGLRGRIPAGLARLPRLGELVLPGNHLSDGIPPQLTNMRSLRWLDLRDNELTGEIPLDFARREGLELWLGGNRLNGCLHLAMREVVRDLADVGLSYCQCPASLWNGASPDLTLGADGIPFMPHEATEVAGTYRITFALVLDLPHGGRFTLGQKERNEAEEIIVSIQEEKSRSSLVVDPFTGEERSRSTVEGPADCPVTIGGLFDQIVASAQVEPLDLPAEPDGVQTMYFLQPVQGGESYRIGDSNFIVDVPDGMVLTSEGVFYVLSGATGRVIRLRDEGSGSWLSLHVDTGEARRRVEEESDGRNVEALFDQIAASVREAPPPTCSLAAAAPDCAVLLAIKELLEGYRKLNWNADLPLPYWDGIAVNRWTGRVIELEFSGNGVNHQIPAALGQLSALEVLSLSGMTGSIPPELGELSNLQRLSLGDSLTGEIPPELGQLSSLRELDLSLNDLTGEIPPGLGALSNLREMDLRWNALTGVIPPELGQLSNLKKLDLSSTSLSGEIPLELVALSNLQELDLSYSDLTGEVPPELGQLRNLRRLRLSGSDLTGEIPAELGSLGNLQELRLGGALTGGIPAELGQLRTLEVLDLGGQLTGEIPPELGHLWRLKELRLANNQLTGEIPAELGHLWGLEALRLANNQLTGEIPASLGELRNLQYIWLADNQLTGEIPPLWAALSVMEMDLSGNRLEGCIPAGLEQFVDSTADSNPELRDCSSDH